MFKLQLFWFQQYLRNLGSAIRVTFKLFIEIGITYKQQHNQPHPIQRELVSFKWVKPSEVGIAIFGWKSYLQRLEKKWDIAIGVSF